MNKRKRNRSNTITAQKPTAQTGFTPSPLVQSNSPATNDPSAKWRWLAFGVITLTLIVGWGLYAASAAGLWPFNEPEKVWLEKRPDPREQPWNGNLMALAGKLPRRAPWKIEAWKAITAEDQLIDRFVSLHRQADPAAIDLLKAMPAGDRPIDEDEFERAVAGFFLRQKGVIIRDIWKGEPDDEGKPRPAARRYMLVTKGQLTSPKMQVLDKGGNVSNPSYSLVDPIVLVEVNGQTIHPLRTELNKAP